VFSIELADLQKYAKKGENTLIKYDNTKSRTQRTSSSVDDASAPLFRY